VGDSCWPKSPCGLANCGPSPAFFLQGTRAFSFQVSNHTVSASKSVQAGTGTYVYVRLSADRRVSVYEVHVSRQTWLRAEQDVVRHFCSIFFVSPLVPCKSPGMMVDITHPNSWSQYHVPGYFRMPEQICLPWEGSMSTMIHPLHKMCGPWYLARPIYSTDRPTPVLAESIEHLAARLHASANDFLTGYCVAR